MFFWLNCFGWIRDQGFFEKHKGHGSVGCGSVAFRGGLGLYLMKAPHGRDSRSGGGATLTRRGDSGGCGNSGMCLTMGMEGPRHACSAYA